MLSFLLGTLSAREFRTGLIRKKNLKSNIKNLCYFLLLNKETVASSFAEGLQGFYFWVYPVVSIP